VKSLTGLQQVLILTSWKRRVP